MMKFAVLLALVAACSAQLPFSYSYSSYAPYHYGAYPYHYGAYPYMYTPQVKSYVAAAPAVHVAPTVAVAKSIVATPAVATAPVVAAPIVAAPAVVAAPAFVKTQYHAQDPVTGSAAYGHSELAQAHSAVQDAAGNKVGSFSHVLPDGTISRTDYVADALGYRVASNSLPMNLAAAPLPVSDTAEVVAARAAHFAEVEKVKSRSKRAITYTGAYASPLAYTSTYPAYGAHYTTPYYGSTYYSTPAVTAYSRYPYYY